VSAIKAGDWVMVVRGKQCCGNTSWIGRVFVAGAFRLGTCCIQCGMMHDAPAVGISGTDMVMSIYRLKRIDPLSDPEEAQTKVEREEKKRSPVNA
jgi:hypothetical protein